MWNSKLRVSVIIWMKALSKNTICIITKIWRPLSSWAHLSNTYPFPKPATVQLQHNHRWSHQISILIEREFFTSPANIRHGPVKYISASLLETVGNGSRAEVNISILQPHRLYLHLLNHLVLHSVLLMWPPLHQWDQTQTRCFAEHLCLTVVAIWISRMPAFFNSPSHSLIN